MSRHLKRLAAPKFWKMAKKGVKWVVRPSPGPHPLKECIPLLVLVRDILKLVETADEGKKIIKRGEVLVDGKIRKDHKFPVGLFDVISIPKIGKNYRIIPNKDGLGLIEIGEKEKNKKLCKIVGKTLVKGSKIQLNLHDGKNILVEENKVMKPKALFADSVAQSETAILIGQFAKAISTDDFKIGQNKLFEWLRENGYLISSGARYNQPMQKYIDKGWFEVSERTVNNPDGSVRITFTTKVTGKGQVKLTERIKG